MLLTGAPDPMLLGRRIRQLRLLQALTQTDLAELAGVSAAAIIRIERGTHAARPSTLRKLAQALGVKPTQLTSNK